jgi:hypothetical protein
MLEGIKILAERIIATPELYDCQPRVMEVKMGDPEVSIDHQLEQVIKIVYDNEHGVFTDEEVNHIKQAEREARRKVFNSWLVSIIAEQGIHLPETREQRKERLEIAEEERKWRIEKEKEKRQIERDRQLAMEQIQQRAKHDEMLRGSMGMARNSLTGGIF